jgi:phage-related protein
MSKKVYVKLRDQSSTWTKGGVTITRKEVAEVDEPIVAEAVRNRALLKVTAEEYQAWAAENGKTVKVADPALVDAEKALTDTQIAAMVQEQVEKLREEDAEEIEALKKTYEDALADREEKLKDLEEKNNEQGKLLTSAAEEIEALKTEEVKTKKK